MSRLQPELSEIYATFECAVKKNNGQILESVEFQNSLIVRTKFLHKPEVRTGDSMSTGIALRCVESSVELVPFYFRQICRNGAVVSVATGVVQLQRCEWELANNVDVLQEVEVAVERSADPQSHSPYFERLRAAADTKTSVEMLLNILPLLNSTSGRSEALFRDILLEYFTEKDETAFGIMNAITATARKNQDPKTKWELEEVGGMVPLRLDEIGVEPSNDFERSEVGATVLSYST